MIPGITATVAIGQSGGGGGYTANGDRLDNSNPAEGILDVASMTEADSSSLTISMWVRSPSISHSPNLLILGNCFIGIGFVHTSDIQVGLNDASNVNSLTVGSADGAFTTGVWHHLFFSAQTNHAAGTKVYNMLLDGVNIVSAPDTTDASPSFNMGFHGKEFGLPTSTSFYPTQKSITDFADVWIAPGQYLDASNLTKFRSAAGKPVNLGANGQLPSGTEPAFFFTGDAASFIFNSGSGDSVTLIGNCTDVTGP